MATDLNEGRKALGGKQTTSETGLHTVRGCLAMRLGPRQEHELMGGSHSVKRGSEAIREDSLRVLYKTDGGGGRCLGQICSDPALRMRCVLWGEKDCSPKPWNCPVIPSTLSLKARHT